MTNEPAERLPERIFQLGVAGTAGPEWKRQSDKWVQEALADERRATVERIRAALGPRNYPVPGGVWDACIAILDAEAAAAREAL